MSGEAAMAANDEIRGSLVRLQGERGAELWALARHLGLAPDEADDAVQETLLRLWSALREGALIERPDAWAFRALYRLCMDRHRWRRRVGAVRDRLRAEPARTSIDPSERFALWDAVEALPARQRAAVYLRYRADLTYEQIGQILGIAAPSARSHVSRALDALRLVLGEEES